MVNVSHSAGDILRILQGFMSDTAARLVLKGTLEALGLRAESLAPQELPRLLEALGPASRHFVDGPSRSGLQEALRRLAPAAEAPAPRTFDIRTEADASQARLEARSLCEELGGRGFQCQKAATGVSELARNQLMYAGGGTLTLHPELTPRRRLKVLAADRGQGIPLPQLELILSGRYRSKTGMGMGILGVKRLADAFDVQTGSSGTRVEFEVWL